MAELLSLPAKAGRITRRQVPMRVDLTAMVDLAFLLITFFMLTTTLQRQEAMKLVMPDKEGPHDFSTPTSRTMTICLGSNNHAVWYMGMPDGATQTAQVVDYSKTGLQRVILNINKRIEATGQPMIVLIKPSSHSIYNNLVNTLDGLNIAKVDRYAIVDIDKQDIDLLKTKKAW